LLDCPAQASDPCQRRQRDRPRCVGQEVLELLGVPAAQRPAHISQPAGPGRPCCFSITRSRANSYSRGPLASSVTRCRTHALVARPCATSATVFASGDDAVGSGRLRGRPRPPSCSGTCQRGSLVQTSAVELTSKQYHLPCAATACRRSYLSP